MVTQRRHLRLLPCRDCDHLRASHYLAVPQHGRQRRHFSRPRDRSTPMPCHVLGCGCGRFSGESSVFACPSCPREYATRASLEIHLYGQHPGLSARERSNLLHSALHRPAQWSTERPEPALTSEREPEPSYRLRDEGAES